MIITKFIRHRGRKPIYDVHFDDSRAIQLSESTIGAFGLCRGDEVNDELLEKINTTEIEMQAKNIAINYLSYRQRSSKEVIDHLTKKRFDRNSAERIVHDLQAIGLINDLEFARMFIRDRIKRKPIGKALLRQQLLAKGIASDVLDKLFVELISPQSQQTAALELAKRRMRLTHHSMSKLGMEQRKKRLTDFLLRHGFSYEITKKTIRSTMGN